MKPLSLIWRGPLKSCNYACPHCPFAKRRPSANALAQDRQALARFAEFVSTNDDWSLEILFAPYGEALLWPWYREALVHLSRLPQVRRIAVQTNGSGPADFVAQANLDRLALCITWHPSQISRNDFTNRVFSLHRAGVRLSVGAVALPEHLVAVEALRSELPAEVSMWINAARPRRRYDAQAMARWAAIDPQFHLDLRPPCSRGSLCANGETVLFVDGSGNIRRCPSVKSVLGNLYTDELSKILTSRPCPRARCDCYLGYAQRPELRLREVYGDDLLSRIRRPRRDG